MLVPGVVAVVLAGGLMVGGVIAVGACELGGASAGQSAEPALAAEGAAQVEPSVALSGQAATPPRGPQQPLQVKFRQGTVIRLRDGRFVSLGGDDVSALQAVLDRYPGTSIDRVFTRSEADLEQDRVRIEARSGRPQPDLNLYYRLLLPPQSDALAVLGELRALPIVETAYAEAPPAPPPVGLTSP
jgi:hypothetical protein